jgi:hypothetical protein
MKAHQKKHEKESKLAILKEVCERSFKNPIDVEDEETFEALNFKSDEAYPISMRPKFNPSKSKRRSKPAIFKCEHCGKTCVALVALEHHLKRKHEVKSKDLMVQTSAGTPPKQFPKPGSSKSTLTKGKWKPSSSKQLFCKPCNLAFSDLKLMTKHMKHHIANNCQGTKEEVIALANTDLKLELLIGTGLLDQHHIMGLNKPLPGVICQGTTWDCQDIQILMELHPQSVLVSHVLDLQCKTCNCWFLCPLSLRYHSMTCQ